MDINLHEIDFSFAEKKILHKFSLLIPDGARICLMGNSGCGKTTLLRLIAGFLTPDSGRISGMDVNRISMLFQDDSLCETFSVSSNILLGCLRGAHPAILKEAPSGSNPLEYVLARHLSCLGLSQDARTPVASCSGGMKRRTALIRAILSDSDLIILDEPFQGLDQTSKLKCIDYINSNLHGRTLLCVTHDPEDADLLHAKVVSL